MMLPSILDLRITSKCNLSCKFCFGTTCKSELSFNQWEILLKKFWTSGVQSIVITGGEPTLFNDLQRLILKAKSIGFSLTLSTNGSLFMHPALDCILSNLDWVSFPLEGSMLKTNMIMRDVDPVFYSKTLKLITYIKSTYNTKIKIGTVVTRKNLNDIEGMVEFIEKYADTWKLYQVYLEGKSQNIVDEFAISDAEYKRLYERISRSISSTVNVTDYSRKTMNGKYLFCEPDGSAMTIENDHEHIFGSFIYQFDEVLKTWNNYVNEEKLVENFARTYFL